MGQMDNETFAKLIKEDYWISNIAHAVGCYDSKMQFKHYRTVTYPIEYIVTEQQIEEAKKAYSHRHNELLDSLKPGELVFVTMGMNFDNELSDSPNNHRIRCNFKNAAGNEYFIELTATMDCKNYYVDFSIQKEYKLTEEGMQTIKHYGACGLDRNSQIPATWDAILNLVNKTYKCNYTTGRLFKHFISPDEYTCIN